MAGNARTRERCGANCRTKDTPCERPQYPGSPRCAFHSGPLTVEGRRNALDALKRGRDTVKRNREIKRRAELATRQWVADFAPESPLVDALIDSGHAAHAGAMEHARRLLTEMRAA
jgi:hypothetical protein